MPFLPGLYDRYQCVIVQHGGLRVVPEIILRGSGPHFFSDPSTPRTHMESEPPPTLRTRKCFNYPPSPLWIKYALTPRTSYPPTPRTRCQQNTPHRTKKCLRPTPLLRIISGTALYAGGEVCVIAKDVIIIVATLREVIPESVHIYICGENTSRTNGI